MDPYSGESKLVFNCIFKKIKNKLAIKVFIFEQKKSKISIKLLLLVLLLHWIQIVSK